MNGRGAGHPTGHRGAEVQALFDRIACRYDLLNHLLSIGIDRRWRRQLADEVARCEPRVILDICTGTGDMAIELARPERGLASVVAVDFSPAMIALAARKLARAGLRARVQPCVGDALCLPFSDGGFDAVTAAFGIRNFEHTDRGLAEAARVLRPGGLLGMLEFLRPSDANSVTALGTLYRRRFLPLVATLAGGDPGAYRYLPSTVDSFDSATEMTTRLESLGFDRAQIRPLTLGIASLILARR